MQKLLLLTLALICSFAFNNTLAFAKDASKETSKETVQVKSYTKKDGTVVKGYTREKKAKPEAETVEVKGYTKKDGTKVAGYTRKKVTKTGK